MHCILLCICVMVLLIMFNWRSFGGNGKDPAKVPLVAMGGCAHATCSLTPSYFVFFAKWELSRHFSHPVVAAIQLLAAIWATPFGCLLSFRVPALVYMFLFTYVYTVVSLVSCLILLVRSLAHDSCISHRVWLAGG